MTTKTREEAIEEANAEILKLVWNGNFSHMIDAESESMCKASEFRVYKSDTGDYKKFPFTPPKSEFEKGTIGLDQDFGICFYKELNSIGDYEVCLYRTSLNETGGYTTSTFTPIYQTDPIEKRAYELACNLAGSLPCRNCPLRLKACKGGDHSDCANDLNAHFKSKAKEELSK